MSMIFSKENIHLVNQIQCQLLTLVIQNSKRLKLNQLPTQKMINRRSFDLTR